MTTERSLLDATLSHDDAGDPVLVLSRSLYRGEHCGHVTTAALTVKGASTVGTGDELTVICHECLMTRWFAIGEVTP